MSRVAELEELIRTDCELLHHPSSDDRHTTPDLHKRTERGTKDHELLRSSGPTDQSPCPLWGRRAGVKTVRGAARPTPLFPWHLRPLISLAPGPCLRVRTVDTSTPVRFGIPTGPPGSPVCTVLTRGQGRN
jgi:hypothetical protein